MITLKARVRRDLANVKGVRGSTLIEGVLAFSVCVLTIMLSVELVRTAQQTVLLRHACFLYVRWRSLAVGEPASLHRVQRWFDLALSGKGKKFMNQLTLEYHPSSNQMRSRASSRYPSLFLPYSEPSLAADSLGPRDRIQFSQQCYFSSRQH